MFNESLSIPDNLINEVYKLAEAHFPQECCGFLVSDEYGTLSLCPCTNVSDYPQKTFTISPVDYVRAEEAGKLEAVVHSHCHSSSALSPADEVSCNISKLPWLVVSLPRKSETLQLRNNEKMPLVGRPFFHQVLDCWSRVVDYYDRELNIKVPSFQRQDNWWNKGQNLYLDLSEQAGFDIITSEKPKINDVIIMQVNSKVPNHGAVYLGDNIILHHMSGRLSTKAVYGGFWEKNTWALLRHKSLR